MALSEKAVSVTDSRHTVTIVTDILIGYRSPCWLQHITRVVVEPIRTEYGTSCRQRPAFLCTNGYEVDVLIRGGSTDWLR